MNCNVLEMSVEMVADSSISEQRLWKDYNDINSVLSHEFLCIPPYRCVNGRFINEIKASLPDKKRAAGIVCRAIHSPFQRAYQMEYRYKHCKIFDKYMEAIEYANLAAYDGNYICSYITMVPIIEALLREWIGEDPTASFNRIRESIKNIDDKLKTIIFFDDDRHTITDAYIGYMNDVVRDKFYVSFDEYYNLGLASVFNRNLTLHRFEGADSYEEAIANTDRIMLVLDVIAELYLMQDMKKYWNITFYATPDANADFQLHKELYYKHEWLSLGYNDSSLLYSYTHHPDPEKTREITTILKNQIKILDFMEKCKRNEVDSSALLELLKADRKADKASGTEH